MSESWATFFFEAANFLLLAAVLGWLFFRPVRTALERRRSELADARSSAAEAKRQAEAELREALEHRAELERSIDALREQMLRDAELERQKLIDSARAQIESARSRATEELADQRRSAAESLARDVARVAGEIVARLLGRIGGPELEAALLAVVLAELERLRSGGALAPVIVESPRPADEAMLSELAKAGGVARSELSARTVPDLVAGLRVLTARGLVDASAAGLAAQAERALSGALEHEQQPVA